MDSQMTPQSTSECLKKGDANLPEKAGPKSIQKGHIGDDQTLKNVMFRCPYKLRKKRAHELPKHWPNELPERCANELPKRSKITSQNYQDFDTQKQLQTFTRGLHSGPPETRLIEPTHMPDAAPRA